MAAKIRITRVIMDILDVLAASPSENPAWGLRICEMTGYGTSTVYPALNRLMKAGWISDFWEDPPPDDRPKKRFYEITSTGREAYNAAVREHDQRRAGWFRPVTEAGPAS